MQMRQRLKEFCDFVRRGHNNGYWKPKGRITIPSEEECRKLILPEMVALYESMLVGQRHLQDTGYGKTAEDGDVDEEGETKLDIEEQLAPWITTRNFVNATQGKSMLQIHGPGDPTGRGEGFSFVRISMKGSFLRAGESEEERLAKLANLPKNAHKYNVAEQQQAYREEPTVNPLRQIDRVWRLQYQALSDKSEIQDSDEEAEEPVSRATSEAVDAESPALRKNFFAGVGDGTGALQVDNAAVPPQQSCILPCFVTGQGRWLRPRGRLRRRRRFRRRFAFVANVLPTSEPEQGAGDPTADTRSGRGGFVAIRNREGFSGDKRVLATPPADRGAVDNVRRSRFPLISPTALPASVYGKDLPVGQTEPSAWRPLNGGTGANRRRREEPTNAAADRRAAGEAQTESGAPQGTTGDEGEGGPGGPSSPEEGAEPAEKATPEKGVEGRRLAVCLASGRNAREIGERGSDLTSRLVRCVPGVSPHQRRCGNCDQIGHIRTNPVCPMYEKTGGQPLKSLPPAPIKFIYSGKSEAAQAATAEKTTRYAEQTVCRDTMPTGDGLKPPQPEVTEALRSVKVEGMKLSIRFTMKKDPPTS
ncbi:MAG: hypothetical protein BJ554DRAFT_1818, partial [Olpidium bornovanus]